MPRRDLPPDFNAYSIYMKNASVEYTKGMRMLSDVTLIAKKGEIFGLLGGSGGGNQPLYIN